jgi:hypothetical protein
LYINKLTLGDLDVADDGYLSSHNAPKSAPQSKMRGQNSNAFASTGYTSQSQSQKYNDEYDDDSFPSGDGNKLGA